MSDLTAGQFGEALASKRYAVLNRLDVDLDDLRHWDPVLARDPRLLVPVDVQALVVRDGDEETMLRLPLRDGSDPGPDPDDRGTVREPGVHLLWTVPEVLGRGRIVDDPTAPGDVDRRQLELPMLPDRWVVVRLAVVDGSRAPLVSGWVIEADTGIATPIEDWPEDGGSSKQIAPAIPADRLTVHVGGPSWTTCYDAAIGRMALHDPLDDLGDAVSRLENDALSYIVAGWWSDATNDPLNGVGSLGAYWNRLADLGWDDVDHPPSQRSALERFEAAQTAADDVGLPRSTRYRSDAAAAATEQPSYLSNLSRFVDGTHIVNILPKPPTRLTLLHGRIHGIPMRSERPDNRPEPAETSATLGPSSTEVTAALASPVIAGDAATRSERRDIERLVAGLGAGLLPRMSEGDMWAEIEHYEHQHGFASIAGGTEAVDRFVPAPPKHPDPRISTPTRRRPRTDSSDAKMANTILWSHSGRPAITKSAEDESAARRRQKKDDRSDFVSSDQPDFRSVTRAAPRFHFPTAPVLAISGAGRELLAAERDEADGSLRCRLSDHVSEGLSEVIDARDLLASLRTGAIPDEVRLIAREALAEDPYLSAFRARISTSSAPTDAIRNRTLAEAAINYAYYAGDNELVGDIVGQKVTSTAERQTATEHLLKHSIDRGVWSHPEGVTMWGQPWRPVFCEWAIDVELARPTRWHLDEVDLETNDGHDDLAFDTAIPIVGRSPVAAGVASSLQAAVDRWLGDERARDREGRGLASTDVERALSALTDQLDRLVLLSVALDGVRERMLGLVYDRGLVRADSDAAADGTALTRTNQTPELIIAGRLTLRAARLVDAFGRTVDVPLEETVRPVRTSGRKPASLQLRPRLAAPARLHLRLVDPLAAGADAATAVVDQTVSSGGVSPVAGFLLPDHIDESLEVFGPTGAPLGQVFHDGFSGAVTWEGAPGRTDVGPGSGPLDDGQPAHRRVGWISSGLVVHDARDRQLTTHRESAESSLAAMLHAIDTTLWTVDPFGSLGREHIAGLVGRPIAVVTAQLTLDVLADLDDHVYVGDATRDDRERAYREIASTPFEIRLGSASRADDGLLGYFLDDDYSQFRVVDRVIAEQSIGGRGPIDSGYIVPDGTISIRHGQTIRLTLLMHPGGRVHLTSGVLPRQSIALSREWVHRGLSTIAPSARVGPLLIDDDKVRLPKIAAFPVDQLFTRRDTPSSWRDDPIVSATHTAFLPPQASVAQEGWIRIAPNDPGADE